MTNEEWNELIEEYKKSGTSVREFCRMKNIDHSAFKYRLYDKHKPKAQQQESSEDVFVPVQIIKGEPVRDSSIEIRLNTNASITVDYSTDLKLLKKIMEVLS